jgi:isopentenyl-diphosphate delta-isomerase
MKTNRRKSVTPSRKRDHVLLTVQQNVSHREKMTGFESVEFVHNALPELNFSEIDPSCFFLGKRLSFPLLISSMTGGYSDAQRINRILAEVCEEEGIAMGVGSQRQAWESVAYHSSFSVVRKSAPTIPIIGNIGAAEVARLTDAAPVLKLIELIGADAFAVHLNPLQELLQPEGNTNFKGVLKGIGMLVKNIPIPVIVKEIGAGISKQTARRLIETGVRIIDVAGAGGTSWAGVEILRNKKRQHSSRVADCFWDWGIPTVRALIEIGELKASVPSLTIIASGGIENGVDIAKSIALKADLGAVARPIMKALFANGKKGVQQEVSNFKNEFISAMFLVGSPTLKELRQTRLRHCENHTSWKESME